MKDFVQEVEKTIKKLC